jgi:hypothetical protein
MHQLLPIIRRKRRPLIELDAAPVVAVALVKPEAEKPTAPPAETSAPEKNDDAPKN